MKEREIVVSHTSWLMTCGELQLLSGDAQTRAEIKQLQKIDLCGVIWTVLSSVSPSPAHSASQSVCEPIRDTSVFNTSVRSSDIKRQKTQSTHSHVVSNLWNIKGPLMQ